MRHNHSPLPTTTRAWSTAVLLLATLVPGCVTEPEEAPPPEGMVSFSYAGDINGSVEVADAYIDPTPVTHSYALARPTVQGDALALVAFRHRGDQVFDILHARIATPTEPGSYPIEGGDFSYGMDGLGTIPDHTFELETGEIVVTGLDADRIQGSFTASGTSRGGPGWDPWNRESANVVIEDGVFDVPVVPSTP